MSFDFDTDTGIADRPTKFGVGSPGGHILDNVRDSLPADASQETIDAAFVLYCLGWLREDCRASTTLRRLSSILGTLGEIADRDPALANSVILEIADRLDRLS